MVLFKNIKNKIESNILYKTLVYLIKKEDVTIITYFRDH